MDVENFWDAPKHKLLIYLKMIIYLLQYKEILNKTFKFSFKFYSETTIPVRCDITG